MNLESPKVGLSKCIEDEATNDLVNEPRES